MEGGWRWIERGWEVDGMGNERQMGERMGSGREDGRGDGRWMGEEGGEERWMGGGM